MPVFRSEHLLRLLGELFVAERGPVSLAELSRATNVPQTVVSREIDRLESAGLVAARRHGRHRLVEADHASPYFAELRALLVKAVGPPYVIGTSLQAVPGVEAAYIFGSWAARFHGQPGPMPRDLDVLVVGDVDLDAVYAACRNAEAVLRLDVNPVVRTGTQWERDDSGFLHEVRHGPLVHVLPTP